MKKKSKKSVLKKKGHLRKLGHITLLASTLIVGAVFVQNAKAPPKIDSVLPEAGSLGTQLTLTGSRFTSITNDILMQGQTLLNDLPSSNGTTITFTLPGNTPCQPKAACPIKVSNENGVSNAMSFKVVEGSTVYGNEVAVTVLTPNGGEVCEPGEYCGITWVAYQNGQLITHEVVGNKDIGLVEVKIALVKDTATNSTNPTNLIVGWIEAQPDRVAAIRDYAWYAATVTDADTQFTSNVVAGTYKILIVTQDANGQYTLWNTNTNTAGNFDVSDAPFTILYRERQ